MEINLASAWNIIKDLAIIVGIPCIRSAAGWAHKALKDNKVTRFEKKKLLQTIIRVGSLGFIGYLGFNIAGVDNAALAAAVGSFIADKAFNALKQNKPVRD